MVAGGLGSGQERILARAVASATVSSLVAALGFTFYKLHFGVDFDDEAFYLAMPYRFVLGDVPFVDYLDLQQTAAFLTYPLVKVWYALHGDLDGIVLFHRRLYYAYSLLVGWTVFLCFRRRHGALAASAAGVLPILFVPLCIPTLSYITLAMGFMSLGLYFVWMSRDCAHPHGYELLAGGSHALACLAFPPYAAGVLLFFGILMLSPSASRPRTLLCYGAPVVIVGTVTGAFLLALGPEHVAEALRVNSTSAGGGLGKLRIVMAQFLASVRQPWLLVGWIALGMGLARWRPAPARWLFALWPLVVWWSLKPVPEHMSTMPFVSLYALSAPLIWWADPGRRDGRLLMLIWVPSVAFGALSAWGAANGFVNSSIGLAPGAVVTSFLLVSLVAGGEEPPRAPWSLLRLAPLVLVGLVLVGATHRAVYRDARLSRLDSRVGSGPYAGLYTRAANRQLLEQLGSDLLALERPAGRILVYNGFAAGYLLTSMRPATPFVWLFPMARMRPVYAARYAENADSENLVLHLKYRGVHPDDALHALVERTHRKVIERGPYAIYAGSADGESRRRPPLGPRR